LNKKEGAMNNFSTISIVNKKPKTQDINLKNSNFVVVTPDIDVAIEQRGKIENKITKDLNIVDIRVSQALEDRPLTLF